MSNAPPKKNDPTTGRDSLGKFVRRNLSFGRLGALWRRGKDTLHGQGGEALWRAVRLRLALATHSGEVWRHSLKILPLKKELAAQRAASFAFSPLISVVVPLYNTPVRFLRDMADSVRRQTYANWQLILVNASDAAHGKVGDMAAQLAKSDSRILLVPLPENGGIAANTNAGFARATGDYISLLDHDDVLQPHALYEVVKALNEDPAQDLFFSDEIVLDSSLGKKQNYLFKFAYGPDTLRGCNFMTHYCVFSRSLLEAVGGENSEFDGAQDYDFILRLSEKAQKICYIPKVLYIWRGHENSTASGIGVKEHAVQAGAAALNAHLARVSLRGTAVPHPLYPGAYQVKYEVQGSPLVSVIIPNYNHAEDLARCLETLYAKAGKTHLEVLVVENNSTEASIEKLYEQVQKKYFRLRVLRYPGAFNFSAICNFGAQHAQGKHLLLLNNDIEILSDGFVDEMLSYSQRPDVGAVGALLYYPDDTVQHAGLIVGIGGTVGVNQKGQKSDDPGDMFRLATTQNFSAVTGAALMLKKPLYEELGGMNEADFAVAFNDVDLCLRLREKGLWNVFTPFAAAYHFESKSRGYDTEGPAKERFEREAAALRTRHAAVFAQGDPFYNPSLTLKTENYVFEP